MRQFGQLLATDNEPQSVMAFSKAFVLALIHKSMVGASARLQVFGRFDQTVSAEIDTPIALCRRFGNLLRLAFRPGVAALLVRKPEGETVGRAGRCGSNESLVSIALREMTRAPCVQPKACFLQDSPA